MDSTAAGERVTADLGSTPANTTKRFTEISEDDHSDHPKFHSSVTSPTIDPAFVTGTQPSNPVLLQPLDHVDCSTDPRSEASPKNSFPFHIRAAHLFRRPFRRGPVSTLVDTDDIKHKGRFQYMRREQLKKERPVQNHHRGRWTIDHVPTSFRAWLIYHLEGCKFGLFYEIFNGILDLCFITIYIIERMMWTPVFLPYILLTPRPFSMWIIVIVMSYIAVALFLLRLYSTLEWRMVFSPYFCIDLLTSFPFIISTFFRQGRFWYIPYFLRCWTACYHIRQHIRIRTQLKEGYSYDILLERIITLIAVLVCIMFSGVAAVNYVENAFGDTLMSFFESIYLVVITASTVGYGDVVPTTIPGRIIIILFIIVVIAVLPTHIGAIVEATRLHRAGGGKHTQYHGGHVVITGAFSNDTHVLDHLREFFHLEELRNTYKVVFLSTIEVSSSISMILNSPFYRSRVTYLVGSPLSTYDLKRASVASASAVFVLSDKFTDTPRDADAQNVMRAWALQNHIDSQRLFVSNVYPDSAVFLRFTEKTVYLDEIGKALMALNTLHRGSSTLIMNLIHRYSPPQLAPTIWEGEYGDGAGNELFATKLPIAFLGMSFTAVAWMLFEYFQVTLFAVRMNSDSGQKDALEGDSGVFLLNPGSSYCMKMNDECFFLAQDEQDMKDIQNFKAATYPDFEDKKQLYIEKIKNQDRGIEPLISPPTSSEEGETNGSGVQETKGVVLPLNDTATYGFHKDDILPNDLDDFEKIDSHDDDRFDVISIDELNDGLDIKETYQHSGNHRNDAILGYPKIFSKGGIAQSWILQRTSLVKDCAISNTQFLHRQPFILLVTETYDVFTLIQLLRHGSLERSALRPIVIMAQEYPSQLQWNSIGVFPEVYHIQGIISRERNLLHAGIMFAETILLVTNNRPVSDHMMIDYHPILLGEKIHSMRIQCPLISELHSRKNLQFAWPRNSERNLDAPFIFSAAYAAGQVVALSMIDSLLFRAFHAPFLFTVTRHLVALKDERHDALVKSLGYNNGFYRSMKVPTKFVGHTFGALFQHLALQEGKIPIALYRAPNVENSGNILPYIYTNPLADTIINADDNVHYIA